MGPRRQAKHGGSTQNEPVAQCSVGVAEQPRCCFARRAVVAGLFLPGQPRKRIGADQTEANTRRCESPAHQVADAHGPQSDSGLSGVGVWVQVPGHQLREGEGPRPLGSGVVEPDGGRYALAVTDLLTLAVVHRQTANHRQLVTQERRYGQGVARQCLTPQGQGGRLCLAVVLVIALHGAAHRAGEMPATRQPAWDDLGRRARRRHWLATHEPRGPQQDVAGKSHPHPVAAQANQRGERDRHALNRSNIAPEGHRYTLGPELHPTVELEAPLGGGSGTEDE